MLCSLTVADYVTVGNQSRNQVVICASTVAFKFNASLRKYESVKNLWIEGYNCKIPKDSIMAKQPASNNN